MVGSTWTCASTQFMAQVPVDSGHGIRSRKKTRTWLLPKLLSRESIHHPLGPFPPSLIPPFPNPILPCLHPLLSYLPWQVQEDLLGHEGRLCMWSGRLALHVVSKSARLVKHLFHHCQEDLAVKAGADPWGIIHWDSLLKKHHENEQELLYISVELLQKNLPVHLRHPAP